MSEPFLIALRESFQCSLLLSLVLCYPPVLSHPKYVKGLASGAAAGLLSGFLAGYVLAAGNPLGGHQIWTFWRYVAETVVFYSSVVILIRRPSVRHGTAALGLLLLGFLLFFFESRALGFITRDMGVQDERPGAAIAAALAGIALGLAAVPLLKRVLRKLPLGEAFTVPSLLMVTGSLQFGFGGVRELENENILVPLQRSILNFTGEAIRSLQKLLLMPEHQFLKVDWTGPAAYLASDRIAMSLAIVFLMAPPVLIMAGLVARPDPAVQDIEVTAHRRQRIAAFRKELTVLAVPVLTAYTVLVVLLHAVNLSMNPLYDPAPAPVREEEREPVLRIPLAERFGDLGDKKLRKFVYYHGSKEVLFIVIMKQDGSLGVALDQCEICRPADWNKDARGYAQKGGNLMCKYCVTPIATGTVNTPGGCNPIPVPFRVRESSIVIALDDLVRTFETAEKLERKGTHL